MVGRPQKYKRGRVTSVYTDEIDLKYLDEHRGKLSRSEYLIEAMYSLKGDTRIVEALSSVKEKDKEIYELKRQLLFERSKKSKASASISDSEAIESVRLAWFETKKEKLLRDYTNDPSVIVWKTLYERYPQLEFDNHHELKDWVESQLRQLIHSKPMETEALITA
jgi:hypothetical protein